MISPFGFSYIYIISYFLEKVKYALFVKIFPIGDFCPETAVSGDKKERREHARLSNAIQSSFFIPKA